MVFRFLRSAFASCSYAFDFVDFKHQHTRSIHVPTTYILPNIVIIPRVKKYWREVYIKRPAFFFLMFYFQTNVSILCTHIFTIRYLCIRTALDRPINIVNVDIYVVYIIRVCILVFSSRICYRYAHIRFTCIHFLTRKKNKQWWVVKCDKLLRVIYAQRRAAECIFVLGYYNR